jgi:3alpha(or 20beta)-hydroxysteroid dehydrogenase
VTGRLDGKVAIITGGAQGMGAAHARRFVREGASIVIADVVLEGAQALAAELGGAATAALLDVTDEAGWAEVIGATAERLGRVDVLVNNAGLLAKGDVDTTTREVWDRVIGVNLTGVFQGMAAVAPVMKRQRSGSIINISSIDGLRGTDHLFAYAASKWGVTGMTKSAAIELGSWSIRVNSVHPGLIETPMSASLGPTRLVIPLDRGADPDEVSSAVLFLASEESAYITGTELVVDGGVLAGIPHREVVEAPVA